MKSRSDGMWWGTAIEAVAPGFVVAEFQLRENVRVLFDPAGHPFCLCVDDA